jgi:hypothetical protein
MAVKAQSDVTEACREYIGVSSAGAVPIWGDCRFQQGCGLTPRR